MGTEESRGQKSALLPSSNSNSSNLMAAQIPDLDNWTVGQSFPPQFLPLGIHPTGCWLPLVPERHHIRYLKGGSSLAAFHSILWGPFSNILLHQTVGG